MMELREYKYLRSCSLILNSKTGKALDLSGLRVSFSVTKGDYSSPNHAEISVYNLSDETIAKVRHDYKEVILSAGYSDKLGLIFRGDIRRFWIGGQWGIEYDKTPTDKILTLSCLDGDSALKKSFLCKSISAGSTFETTLKECEDVLEENGIGRGIKSNLPPGEALPRGKAFFGSVSNCLSSFSRNTDSTWSIQDGRLFVLSQNKISKSEEMVFSPEHGLIGNPKRGDRMVEFSTLLENRISVHDNVRIKGVQGIYEITGRVVTIQHKGDTHGNEWITNIKAVISDVTEESVVK